MNANAASGDELLQAIVDNTKGFVFLGVPHKGSRLTFLGEMLAIFGHWRGSRAILLEVLRPGSAINETLHDHFMGALDRCCGVRNTVCVFESVFESFLCFKTQVGIHV